MGFGDRLHEYRLDRGLKAKEMAELLGIHEQTYFAYLGNSPNDPSYGTAINYAQRMMVSLDWLAGLDVPMWSEALWEPYREKMQAALEANPIDTYIYKERMAHIIRLLHAIDPARFDGLFLKGLLGMRVADIQTIIDGGLVNVKEEVADIIKDRLRIHLRWLHTGNEPQFR